MRIRSAAVAAWFALTSGCAPKFDTQREPDPGTFGERVVTLMCKRLAYEADRSDVRGDTYRETCHGGALPDGAPATVATIAADRARLVAAIDSAVPSDTTAALQAYLTSAEVLGMYDDDTMAKTVASLSDLLEQMGTNRAAMDAFARLGGHQGYRPVAHAIGPTGAMTNAAGIDGVFDDFLPTITAGGAAEPQWNALIGALSATFADATVPTDAVPDRASTLLAGLFLTERTDIAETTAVPLVRRDRRGVAIVELVAGEVPAPFTDLDGDKLADVDTTGRFVDAVGLPIAVPTPFPVAGDTAQRDADGRAVDSLGAPIYAYFDIGKTVIGAMGHDTQTLVDPERGTAIDFARGASLLLGPRIAATKTFDNGSTLDYQGYDTTQSPLLDLAYAYTQLLRDPNTKDVLALTLSLFGDHAAATARLAEDAIETARLADAHPEAQILANAPLWDDMRPILQRITSKPQLVRDMMDALKQPEVKLLATRFREFMTYSDRFDIDQTTQAVTGALATMPNRAMPDTGFNRSLFQRLLMVISDSQVSQCNKANAQVKDPLLGLPIATYAACALFKIDNLAVFYLQSIVYAKDATGKVICESNAGAFAATQAATTGAGCAAFGAGWRPRPKANFNYTWGGVVSTAINLQGGDAFVEAQAGIVGFRTHPTPNALNRVLFLPTTPQTIQDTSDPILDKDGDLMKVQHAGTLPVWEKNNFYDQIRPVVQAFADAGEEQTFVDLMTVLNKHWSSMQSTTTQHTNPAGGNFTFGSDTKSYEPYVAEVLAGDLWKALTETAPELTAITVNGKSFATVLANSGHFVVSPIPGLADRQGKTTSLTSDGKPVAVLSPWHLLADAYTAKHARLAEVGDAGKSWTDSTTELVDLLYRADKVGATWTFRNAHAAATTRAITQFLGDRLIAHDLTGDRIPWLATELPESMRNKLTHPVFATIVDLFDVLTVQGAPRRAIEVLLHEIFDPTTVAFNTMRVGNADLVQLSTNDVDLVPIGRLVGSVLGSDVTYLATQLAFLNRLHAADTMHTLRDITARMFRVYDASDPGVPTISAIVDGVGNIDRVNPNTAPAWSGADYASVFRTVGEFLRETQYGLPRFIAIVKGRQIP